MPLRYDEKEEVRAIVKEEMARALREKSTFRPMASESIEKPETGAAKGGKKK